MTILKRGYRIVLAFFMITAMFFALPIPAQASECAVAEPVIYTEEALFGRITQTYTDAKKVTGYRSFNGRCSSMVNGSVVALGIHEINNRGNGRDIYDRYKNIGRTSGGYDVVCYDAAEYDLETALLAVSENGTRDVYNLIVGWESGRTGSSSAYGHAVFVHGILDGRVYFSESFGLELLNGEYYREGAPIVCSIGEFAAFYDKWAYFEGLIHFDYPDETAPVIRGTARRLASGEGFTLTFRAEDAFGVTERWAKVWRTGETEEDAVTLPVTVYEGAAALRVNTGDFGDCRSEYFVRCYATDRKGNVGKSGILCVRLDLLTVSAEPDHPAVLSRLAVPGGENRDWILWAEQPEPLRQAHNLIQNEKTIGV